MPGGPYSAQAHVQVSFPASNGLLVNSFDDPSELGTTLTVDGTGTIPTSQNGQVTVNTATGAFTYDPPVSFTGDDSFDYRVCDDGIGLPASQCSLPITVEITVSGPVVWFIDSTSQASPGDGRLATPFESLASFNSLATDSPGDVIFVDEGSSSPYTGGLTLLNNQQLIGQGVDLAAVTGISPPSGSLTLPGATANPTIENISLASGNTIRGIDLASTGVTALQGSSVGTLTVSDVDSISATGARAVDLAGGSASLVATFGDVTVSGSSAGGINLNNNAGSFSFASVDITTTGGTGILASNSGSLTVAGGTVASTDGTAVSITDTTIGASGMTFESISASGGSNGIVLDNSGTTGSFTVTGTGAPGSGGTLETMTGADGSTAGIGIRLDQARGISLTSMQLNTFDNFAIRGTNVTNFGLADSVISGTNGTSAVQDEGSVSFDNLLGAATFNNNTISGGLEDNIVVTNSLGTLNITVTGGTIGLNSTSLGNDGILVKAQGSAAVDLTVSGVTFLGARGDLLQTNALGTSAMTATIRDNTFQNSHTNIVSGGGGITISGGSATSNITVTYDISGTTPGAQTFRDAVGNAITANFVNGAGTVTGTIKNNTIGATGFSGSGSTQGSGISVGAAKNVSHTVTIDNNTVREVKGFGGIDVVANTDVTFNATIKNNTVVLSDSPTANFGLAALTVLVGGTGTEVGTSCLDIRSNTFDSSGAPFAISATFFDQISTSANYNLPAYAGSANGEFVVPAGTASPQIASYLTGLGNTLTDPAFPSFAGADASLAFGVTGTGSTCP